MGEIWPKTCEQGRTGGINWLTIENRRSLKSTSSYTPSSRERLESAIAGRSESQKSRMKLVLYAEGGWVLPALPPPFAPHSI